MSADRADEQLSRRQTLVQDSVGIEHDARLEHAADEAAAVWYEITLQMSSPLD